MVGDDLDADAAALRDRGWAGSPIADPLKGLSDDELAMAGKLLLDPPPATPGPTATYAWHWYGREWWIMDRDRLVCRGFALESLRAEARKLKARGIQLHRDRERDVHREIAS